jgi:heme-degrading monooxygenase HmoA
VARCAEMGREAGFGGFGAGYHRRKARSDKRPRSQPIPIPAIPTNGADVIDTTIQQGDGVMTLINVFTVEPEHQQELLDLLAEATEQVMAALPGFVSANLHRSADGTRVVNYAQWRSLEDFTAMQQDENARVHIARAAQLASFEPIICQVAYVHHA